MRPEGTTDKAMTQLLTASSVNGSGNGGGGGAGGGQAVVGTLMATGNTHHLFDSAPPIQERFVQSCSNSLKWSKLVLDTAGIGYCDYLGTRAK